jgi:hypothetical protein
MPLLPGSILYVPAKERQVPGVPGFWALTCNTVCCTFTPSSVFYTDLGAAAFYQLSLSLNACHKVGARSMFTELSVIKTNNCTMQ